MIYQREFCSEQKRILADLPQHHSERLFRSGHRLNLATTRHEGLSVTDMTFMSRRVTTSTF
jgi:hypothetical protein